MSLSRRRTLTRIVEFTVGLGRALTSGAGGSSSGLAVDSLTVGGAAGSSESNELASGGLASRTTASCTRSGETPTASAIS